MDRENKPVLPFKERIEHLVSEMDIKSNLIGIPTPAMAEVLVRAGTGRSKYIKILSDTWKFQLLPFDSRAAIEASELIADIKSKKEKWDTWAKVKFDIQIVSIAKAEGCVAIYSDDRDIEKLASRLKIRVLRICDLPLPPTAVEQAPRETLFEMGNQPAIRFPEPVSPKSVIAEVKVDEQKSKKPEQG